MRLNVFIGFPLGGVLSLAIAGRTAVVALPLTYFPILVVANDPDYMGEHVNGRLANGLGMVYLVLIGVAAVAAIPPMIWTRMGA